MLLEDLSKEDRSLIEDFVEDIKEWAPQTLNTIILYGSLARGDYHPRSDIDLLLVFDEEDPSKHLSDITTIISDMKPHREIKPVLTNLKDVEPALLKNIVEEGIVLFGKIVLAPENIGLRHYRIISYNLSDVSATIRARVARRVYGYTSRKRLGDKIKEYSYEGLIERKDCFVFGKGVIALPSEDADGFMFFLDRNGVKYRSRDVWI